MSSSFSGMKRFNLLMQVLEVGRNEVADKTKHKDGGSAYRSIGSSSAPVTNCNILFNVTLRKGSPENKAVMHHDCNF